ncbi:MAG: hypothetical protein QTN59_12485 [Candidatus Electrothrix communis]|nr:MAG: hypothetical protein QTN59_12485 [Candidatus Electrothrix communis]
MNNEHEQSPATPKAALNQLKEWQELIGYIAAGLTGVLGTFLSGGAVQIASTALAAVAVAAGGWQVRRSRRRKKQQVEQERLWEERRKQPRAAFRNLSPFEEQDELPGQDRKQQARSIAVRIVNDDFRFGIICGESGAGKTSLLRAEVMRYIQANGWEPVYIRTPRLLTENTLVDNPACERLSAKLDAFAQEHIPTNACVLILDQFEEWFIAYREPEARALMGRFIARLTERVPPVKVVCAVRREFLMDFHELSPELPDPTQPNNTFRIRNFTVAQAIDAVQECATTDGIAAEESFATALTADLEDNGEIRPPELQIICTHLAESGGLSSSQYQAEGGTAGILAHYIKNALESCREPELGAKLLRSLCDFPTRTKRPSKTLTELATDIGGIAGRRTIAALVRTFVLARLLTEEKRTGSPDAYTLMHDYLVGAVELATGDVSTKTEEANQLLRYYLAQQRGVIPLRRLRFIRAHADRPLLTQPNARRLFRKSLITPALVLGVTVFVAVLMAGGLYLAATTEIQWRSKVIGRHWDEGETGFVRYYILPESEQVISGLRPERNSHMITGSDSGKEKSGMTVINKIWNAKTGMVVGSNKILDKNTAVSKWLLSKKEDYIIICGRYSNKRKKCELIKFDDLSRTDLPYLDFVYSASLTKSEDYINYTTYNGSNHYTAALWSVKGENIARQVKNIKNPDDKWNISFQFSADRNRLVALSQEIDLDIIVLYDTTTGKKIKKLTDQDKIGVKVALHSLTKKVCTVSENSRGKIIQLWNLNDGSFIRERNISTYDDPMRVHFTNDGRYIFLGQYHANFDIVTTYDLKPAYGVKCGDMHLGNDKDKHSAPIVYWRDRKDVKLWHVSKGEPILLQNIKLGDRDSVSSSTDMQRAVIYGPLRPTELWDVNKKKRLRLLTSSKDKYIRSVVFTMNDTALLIEEESELVSLFDAKDGSPLAQHISDAEIYYYDPDLRRIHLWNSSGQVIRYVEGRSYFGYFVPTIKGAWE